MQLSKRVQAATGPDKEIDRWIADLLDHSAAGAPEYAASVDACIDLVHRDQRSREAKLRYPETSAISSSDRASSTAPVPGVGVAEEEKGPGKTCQPRYPWILRVHEGQRTVLSGIVQGDRFF